MPTDPYASKGRGTPRAILSIETCIQSIGSKACGLSPEEPEVVGSSPTGEGHRHMDAYGKVMCEWMPRSSTGRAP